MAEPTIQELQNKIGELTELIHRQSKIIQQTGQQVLELQIRSSQEDFRKLDGDDERPDYATNDDIVQLVGELQGQLEYLDMRSIRRTQNITLSKDDDVVEPLPNADGELYQGFPTTYKKFLTLETPELIKICEFYDLIPPSLEQELKLGELLEKGGVPEGESVQSQLKEDLDKRQFTKEEIGALHEELRRFIGLKVVN